MFASNRSHARASGINSSRQDGHLPTARSSRPSPDAFGLVFHVATPLQDSVGVITPSSLHYVATTRGSFIPDIDPAQHSLMIHGMVDRPLTFTLGLHQSRHASQ